MKRYLEKTVNDCVKGYIRILFAFALIAHIIQAYYVSSLCREELRLIEKDSIVEDKMIDIEDWFSKDD